MLRLITLGIVAVFSGVYVADVSNSQLAVVTTAPPLNTTITVPPTSIPQTTPTTSVSTTTPSTVTPTTPPPATQTQTSPIVTQTTTQTTGTCSEAVVQLYLELMRRTPYAEDCAYLSALSLSDARKAILNTFEYKSLHQIETTTNTDGALTNFFNPDSPYYITPLYSVTVCNGVTWTTCPAGQKLFCPPPGTGTGMCVDERVVIDYAPPTDDSGTGDDTDTTPTGDFPEDFDDGNLIPEIKITSFKASPSFLFWSDSAYLTWSSENATSCVSDSFDTGGATNNNTGVLVSPYGSFDNITYTIFCKDDLNRQVSAEVTVTKLFHTAPTVTSFTASSTRVATGEPSTLTWVSDSATSCISPDFETDGAATNEVGVVVNPVVTTTYKLTCFGKNMFGFKTSVDQEVTVEIVESLCPYVALSLSEIKTDDPEHPIAFSVLDASRHDQDISSGISPYFEEDGATYILKVFNKSASTTPKKFALDSSRFAIFENFSETEPDGQIVEFDSGTISTVIPYDGSITGIQIDDAPVIPVNLSALSCVRSCRLENESVQLGAQVCCGALQPKEVGYSNTFTCVQ